MIKERCRKKWTIKQQWPLFVKLPEIHQKKGLQDEMVDFGKFGRCSRFRTVCFGFFLVFVGGGLEKKTEEKNISHPTLLGTERLSLRASPQRVSVNTIGVVSKWNWMRGKDITYDLWPIEGWRISLEECCWITLLIECEVAFQIDLGDLKCFWICLKGCKMVFWNMLHSPRVHFRRRYLASSLFSSKPASRLKQIPGLTGIPGLSLNK